MVSSQSQLEIVSKQLVKPSYPTPPSLRHLNLSFLDQFQNLGANYVPLIFFYQNDDQLSPKIDPSKRSHQLKQSLSETLAKFYPFAGRINRNNSIDCNDSGALYVEARVRARLTEAIQDATTKDLEQYLPVDTCPNLWSNDRSNHVMLAVQTSFFECGGMAVGVCLSHVIADAHSLLTFMNVWAQKCNSTADISMQPDFDMRLNRFPPNDLLSDVFDRINERKPYPTEQKIVMKRFVFDKNILLAMKLQVSACHNPSRVEIVSSFVWKHLIDITRAKSHDLKKKFVAFHAVNMRPRITPPLPGSAIGNISLLTAAAMSESENSRDYLNLVSPLRMAIRNVANDYVKDEAGRLEYVALLCERPPENEYYLFSSWCRFPYYEVDYGWGKPLSVCTTSQHLKNTIILMDTRSGDGVQAWINMEEDEMAMLPHEFLALENNDFTK